VATVLSFTFGASSLDLIIKRVIPEAHGKPDLVLQNATALKALVKGPYGETDVIGGMISDGY
jgi:hypothetical protein